MPHSCACVYLWNHIRLGLADIFVVAVLANVSEVVETGQFYFLVISSSSQCQGVIREDAVEIWCYEEPAKYGYVLSVTVIKI